MPIFLVPDPVDLVRPCVKMEHGYLQCTEMKR